MTRYFEPEQMKLEIEERCRDFEDTYGVKPDAIVVHPAEPYAEREARDLGLTVWWDPFCPRGKIYPVHRESLETVYREHLERTLREAGAALELWKAANPNPTR